jgi:predicted ATPase
VAHDVVPVSARSRDPDVSAEAVRAQLARILQSTIFAHAPHLSRLLSHLVDRTLDGGAEQLKEYSLGVDVFDRGQSFDPRSDTIVRVQARRLRAKLKDYYSTHGRLDSVRIEVPTGRYVAVFGPISPLDDEESCGAHSCPSLRRFAPLKDAAADDGLPVARTSFIGRQEELEEIKGLLRTPGVRLLTLTGAAGSGKTRLAIEAVRDLIGGFPGGVHLLPLAPLVDAGSVATALAHMVGLRQTGPRSLVEALLEYVKESTHAPTLLVLDNFEHVLGASPLAASLLESSSHLRILVTSREMLHLYGEQEYPVPPLRVPAQTLLFADLAGNPSVRLFAERARAASRAFELTDGNVRAVAEVCRRLDGLPLAIELAAARSKIFSPEAILKRLGRSLDFLTGGPRDLPARQQTLRNTIDWSHTLLSASEQKLFRRLAVFAGGCTLEGAEAVCDAARDLGIDVVSGMSSLVDKSLVQQAAESGGEPRFTMLSTLREYACEQLRASGDELLARRAHAAYCIVLAEEGNPQLTAVEREMWLSRCDVEEANLLAALDWVVDTRNADWAARLGLALFGYWERREHLAEGRRRLLAILQLRAGASPTPAWALVTTYAATLSDSQGDGESARRLHEQSLEAWRSLGDQKGVASALNAVAVTHRFAGDHAAARSYFEQTVNVCEAIGDPAEIAAALSNLATTVSTCGDEARARALLGRARAIFRELGQEIAAMWTISHLADVALLHGHADEAQRLYQEAVDGFSGLGDLWGTARSSADLGHVTSEMGDHRAAHTLFIRALAMFLDLDHKRGIARVLEGLAYLAQRQQDFDRALMLAGAAVAVRHAFGAAPRLSEKASLDCLLAPAWESQDHAKALASWNAGRQMSLDAAVEYARRVVHQPHDS